MPVTAEDLAWFAMRADSDIAAVEVHDCHLGPGSCQLVIDGGDCGVVRDALGDWQPLGLRIDVVPRSVATPTCGWRAEG